MGLFCIPKIQQFFSTKQKGPRLEILFAIQGVFKHPHRLSKKNAPQSEYKIIMLISKKYYIITNELFSFL